MTSTKEGTVLLRLVARLFDYHMPRRFLRGGVARLVPAIVAMACGVALVCAFDLANRGVLEAFSEVVDEMAGRAALQVTSGDDGLLPESLVDSIARVSGVARAVAVVAGSAFTTDPSGERLTVHGIDVTSDAEVRTYDAHGEDSLAIADPLEFLADPDSIVLTREFARRRDIAVGDHLELVTPKGRHSFTIRGLLEPRGVARAFGGNLLVIDRAAAQAAFARPGFVHRIDVVLERSADRDLVSRAISETLPAGIEVQAPRQRKADLQAVMRSFQTMLRACGLVALVAAFLICFNRLSTVFDARAHQIGILRAVGVRRGATWWELVKESLVVGAAGSAIGVPAGIVLGRLVLPVVATSTALAARLTAPKAGLSVSAYGLLAAIALALLASLLAASLPAWRATHLPVATLLRQRGREVDERPHRIVSWTRAGAISAPVLAIVAQGLTRDSTWGLIATALLAVATAALARPLVESAQPLVYHTLDRVLGPTGRLASASLQTSPRRAAITVAMLGVGLGTVLWLHMLAGSFEHTLLRVMPGVLRGDLAVDSVHVEAGSAAAPLDERLVDAIRALPDVSAAAGERVLYWRDATGPLAINAFDPAYFDDPSFGEWPLVEGPPGAAAAVAEGKAVLASTNLCSQRGLGVGDEITLSTPSGILTLPIAGIVHDFLSPQGTVEISRDLLRQHWHDHQVVMIQVESRPGADREALRREISRRFGAHYDLKVYSQHELLDGFSRQVRRAFLPADILAAMVLVVVLLGMGDTLAAGLADRARELAGARGRRPSRRVDPGGRPGSAGPRVSGARSRGGKRDRARPAVGASHLPAPARMDDRALPARRCAARDRGRDHRHLSACGSAARAPGGAPAAPARDAK